MSCCFADHEGRGLALSAASSRKLALPIRPPSPHRDSVGAVVTATIETDYRSLISEAGHLDSTVIGAFTIA
mgnify:CR=1 FL=1